MKQFILFELWVKTVEFRSQNHEHVFLWFVSNVWAPQMGRFRSMKSPLRSGILKNEVNTKHVGFELSSD